MINNELNIAKNINRLNEFYSIFLRQFIFLNITFALR